MVFSSLSFLFFFLPPVILIYYLLPRKCRNYWLFAASVVFYACGDLRFLPVFLIGILWNYLFGLWIGRGRGKKGILVLCLIGDLGILGFYKYAVFLAESFQGLTGISFNIPEILLPIGISFFTFQEISYVVDVYRGVPAQKNPFYLGMYIAFFPQLIAGPILRYSQFAPQMTERKETLAGFTEGFYRFAAGMCKKVLFANMIGVMADRLLAGEGIDERCAPLILMGVFGFALQLYLDFSGYSDMAIGLGRMFGFSIPENFKDPYCAVSATDFWRRWHISLSGWFRDYVYIPLGGSRAGTAVTIRNLFVVWFLTGMWHGAAWPCILWGVLWGVWLVLEKFVFRPKERPAVFGRVYRIFTVLAAMCLFSCLKLDSFSLLSAVWGRIFTPAAWAAASGQLLMIRLWLHEEWVFILAAVLLSSPLPARIRGWMEKTPEKAALLRPAGRLILLAGAGVCVSVIVGNGYNPFLYFQF